MPSTYPLHVCTMALALFSSVAMAQTTNSGCSSNCTEFLAALLEESVKGLAGSIDSTPVVLAEWTIAGNIESAQSSGSDIQAAIARETGVESSAISLSFISASVKLFAIITIPSGMTGAAIEASITTRLSKALATSAFGTVVETEPTAATTYKSAADGAINGAAVGAVITSWVDNYEKAATIAIWVIVGISAGAAVGCIAICICIYCCCCRNRAPKPQATA